jgi:hypothetical protein
MAIVARDADDCADRLPRAAARTGDSPDTSDARAGALSDAMGHFQAVSRLLRKFFQGRAGFDAKSYRIFLANKSPRRQYAELPAMRDAVGDQPATGIPPTPNSGFSRLQTTDDFFIVASLSV